MSTLYGNISTWFDTYVRGFYSEDESLQENIRLKEDHTRRVVAEAEDLADYLGLDKPEKELISASALLHDIARFEQITRFRSFKDRETRDHGNWGADIIRDCGILDGLEREEQDLVLTAVRLHNKFVLPADLDERTLFHCRILRDADKIDILHVVTSRDVSEYGVRREGESLPGSDNRDYNLLVVDSLLRSTNADYHNVRSLVDMYLLQLSWMFALNFPHHSLRVLSERGYIEKLMAKLPSDDTLDRVRKHLRAYIDSCPATAR